MFEKSALLEETKKVRGLLDKEQYPETYAALSDVFINEDSIAELDLFRMVKDGDYMYKKSLRAAIEGQERAHAQLAAELPEQEWTYDD